MAKIVFAKDYGYRKVIRVCLNPDESEWVHIAGQPVRGPAGETLLDAAGQPRIFPGVRGAKIPAPLDHTGNTPPETGRVSCYSCRSNWRIEEFILEGEWLKATEVQVRTEVARRLAETLIPAPIDMGIVGTVI